MDPSNWWIQSFQQQAFGTPTKSPIDIERWCGSESAIETKPNKKKTMSRTDRVSAIYVINSMLQIKIRNSFWCFCRVEYLLSIWLQHWNCMCYLLNKSTNSTRDKPWRMQYQFTKCILNLIFRGQFDLFDLCVSLLFHSVLFSSIQSALFEKSISNYNASYDSQISYHQLHQFTLPKIMNNTINTWTTESIWQVIPGNSFHGIKWW